MSRYSIEHDMELAQKMIQENDLGLVAIRDGKVIMQSEDRGVRPFVQAITDLGDELNGVVIGDRVVGRASAMLCIYSGAVAVYTPLVSDAAEVQLQLADIRLSADKKTPYILNRQRTDMCPFEKMIDKLKSPDEVFHTLRNFLKIGVNH